MPAGADSANRHSLYRGSPDLLVDLARVVALQIRRCGSASSLGRRGIGGSVGIRLDPIAAIAIASGLFFLAFCVFARVRFDYRGRGLLTRPVAALQTGYFFIYALCSYLFLDSRLTAIASSGVLLGFAVLLMMAGLSVVLLRGVLLANSPLHRYPEGTVEMGQDPPAARRLAAADPAGVREVGW